MGQSTSTLPAHASSARGLHLVPRVRKAPEGTEVFVGCDLRDGRCVSGYLDWYNTDVDEVADRDIALNRVEVTVNGRDSAPSGFQKIILSARDISSMHVSYLGMPAVKVARSPARWMWTELIALIAGCSGALIAALRKWP